MPTEFRGERRLKLMPTYDLDQSGSESPIQDRLVSKSHLREITTRGMENPRIRESIENSLQVVEDNVGIFAAYVREMSKIDLDSDGMDSLQNLKNNAIRSIANIVDLITVLAEKEKGEQKDGRTT